MKRFLVPSPLWLINSASLCLGGSGLSRQPWTMAGRGAP